MKTVACRLDDQHDLEVDFYRDLDGNVTTKVGILFPGQITKCALVWGAFYDLDVQVFAKAMQHMGEIAMLLEHDHLETDLLAALV